MMREQILYQVHQENSCLARNVVDDTTISLYGLFAGQSVAFRSTNRGGFQDIFQAIIEDQDIDIVYYFNVQVSLFACFLN